MQILKNSKNYYNFSLKLFGKTFQQKFALQLYNGTFWYSSQKKIDMDIPQLSYIYDHFASSRSKMRRFWPLCSAAQHATLQSHVCASFWYQRPTEPTHTQLMRRAALCIAKNGSRRVAMRRAINFQSCFMSVQMRLCQ